MIATINNTVLSTTTLPISINPWQARAADLIQWTIDHLVNRGDAWGAYRPISKRREGKGNNYTAKARDGKGLDRAILLRHFKGKKPEHVIGLHAISPQNTCRWGKLDFDQHGDDDDKADRNFEEAIQAGRRAIELGFRPILSDSNGRGGYHLEVIFCEPIAARTAHHFARWLARGTSAEAFPKQDSVDESRPYGNWIRLHGRHHTRDHWERVWSWEQERWLDGSEAVAEILSHEGDDPASIPTDCEEAKPEPPPRLPPPPRPSYINPQDHLDRCFNALLALRTHVGDTGFTRLFAGACRCVEYDLDDGEAMEVLRRWLKADPLPYPWTDDNLAQKLHDADKTAERGKANRPFPTNLHSVNGFSNDHADGSTQPEEPTRNLDEYRKDMVQARLDSLLLPGSVNGDFSPTGTGKTTSDIPAAKRAGTSLTVLPTHKNCEEVEASYNAAGLDAVAYPSLNRKTCQNLDEATRAMNAGLSASGCVCLSCPYKAECDYKDTMAQAEGASHRIATHRRTELSFNAISKGSAYITIHEDPTKMFRPTAEIRVGIETITAIAKHAKDDANDRKDYTAYHFFWKMEECCYWLVAAMCEASVTVNLAMPAAAGKPGAADSDLWRSIVSLGVYPNGDAMRLIKALAAGELHEVAIRVDQVFAPGKELQTHKAILGIWQTKIPPQSVLWINDATGKLEAIEQVVGRPVIDRTPGGKIAQRHRVVQIPTDITQSTGARRLLVVVQAVLQAFPDFSRIGIVCHRCHVPILRGTAKDPPVLNESARQRISKIEYFRGGENRASNHWTEQCDFLIVIGTPRVPPSVVRTHLMRIGQHAAAALDNEGQQWGPLAWHGKTEDGRPCLVPSVGYANPEWAAAHHALVQAELMQTVGRGRAICENGIPVVVLTNENLEFPILELQIDAGWVNNSDNLVLSAVRELSTLSPTGEQVSNTPELSTLSPIYIVGESVVSSNRVPTTAIAEKTGFCYSTTKKILNRLFARNCVIKHGQRGGWTLLLTKEPNQ